MSDILPGPEGTAELRLILTLSNPREFDVPRFFDAIRADPSLLQTPLYRALVLYYWNSIEGLAGDLPFDLTIEAIE
jgi:hypothetical protein